MNVLVTGGSSLIGRGLIASLHQRGDVVRSMQRSGVDELGAAGIEQTLGDVADPDAVERAVQGSDAVVHLAAKVGIVGSRSDFVNTNVHGTELLLSAAAAHSVTKFVHVSSPSVAHDGSPIIGGGADPAISEHGAAWYPHTKAIAERSALAAATSTLGVTAIRPHLVWGPGDTQLVGRIVDRARSGQLALVGGGCALVDTTYIDNAVGALVAALDEVAPGAPCSGRAYVVANGEPRPVRELVGGICRAARVAFEPRNVALGTARVAGSIIERVWPRLRTTAEPPLTRFLADQLGTAHWFDPRPARRDLGWEPTVSIDEGLERLQIWFDAERMR